MSLEEYEAWRAKQSGYPVVPEVESILEKERKELAALRGNDEVNEGLGFDIKENSTKKEMGESLNKLWKDTVESEKQFLAQLKAMKASENRKHNTPDETQQLAMYKEQKDRIQGQLKFVKKNL